MARFRKLLLTLALAASAQTLTATDFAGLVDPAAVETCTSNAAVLISGGWEAGWISTYAVASQGADQLSRRRQ